MDIWMEDLDNTRQLYDSAQNEVAPILEALGVSADPLLVLS